MTNLKLQELRKQIDTLDEELLGVLAKRNGVVQEIGKVKKAAGLHPFDEKRWKEMLELRLGLAKKLGVSSELVQKLFEDIHEHSLEIEKKI